MDNCQLMLEYAPTTLRWEPVEVIMKLLIGRGWGGGGWGGAMNIRSSVLAAILDW